MTLNVEELQKKSDSLRQEAVVYAQGVQAEINQLQQNLQVKVREAQKIIDNKEGQIKGLEELIKEMGGAVAPTLDFPAPENN
jgi:hypothetical protein